MSQEPKRDSVSRFSGRVERYVKYRPGYPPGVLGILKKDCHLDQQSVIADIGSGTGKLTELFLKNGNVVFGIEPNQKMRDSAEELLGAFSNFRSREGNAECTGLPGDSVDFVAAGQAFHWFDREKARTEFERILRPPGWVVLVWNERKTDSSPFLVEYENVLQTYSVDYRQVDHRQINQEVLAQFFGSRDFELSVLPNQQTFDFEGLKGRALSSSYTPDEDDPGFLPMLQALESIFRKHESDGIVTFDYDTKVYYGRMAKAMVPMP